MTPPSTQTRDTLSPHVSAEMERMWAGTALPTAEIAAQLNARFGTTFAPRHVEWHARRRCWTRERMSKSWNNRSVVTERLFTAALTRWADGRPADNVVRLVTPGTFPTKGFRLGVIVP